MPVEKIVSWLAVAFVALLQLFAMRYIDHIVTNLKEVTRDVSRLSRDVAVLQRDVDNMSRSFAYTNRKVAT